MKEIAQAFAEVRKSRSIWLLHFVGNAFLLLFAVFWLRIPEAHIWELALALLLAVLVVFLALTLHSGTMVWFHEFDGETGPGLAAAFRVGARRAFPFFLWAAFLLLLLFYVDTWTDNTSQWATYLRSALPFGIRRHFAETEIAMFLEFLSSAVYWVLIPGLAFPLGMQTALHGFGAFADDKRASWWKTIVDWRYWLLLILLAVVGIYVPQKLMAWLPRLPSLTGEKISLAVRLFLAYALAVTSWLTVLAMLGRSSGDGIVTSTGREPVA